MRQWGSFCLEVGTWYMYMFSEYLLFSLTFLWNCEALFIAVILKERLLPGFITFSYLPWSYLYIFLLSYGYLPWFTVSNCCVQCMLIAHLYLICLIIRLSYLYDLNVQHNNCDSVYLIWQNKSIRKLPSIYLHIILLRLFKLLKQEGCSETCTFLCIRNS